MNKLKYIGLFICTLCLLASCKKDTLLTYDAKDNIYFNWGGTPQQVRYDSVSVSFGFSPESVKDTTIMIPMAVTGSAANTDREFNISVDPASTEIAATHYVLPTSFVMHAGKVLDSFPVKLLRAADLEDTVQTLILNLSPNDNFNTDIKIFPGNGISDTVNALQLRLFVADGLTAGPYWNNCAYYFGTFSVKKVRLLNTVTGMPLDFPSHGIIYDLGSSAEATLYAITMNRYLQDQAAAGHPVYEDDGVTLMTMGAIIQ
ncbi:hypothetical protein A9P82_04780 [Arachidicoccus ginsenosidimutans]|uniref:DUF4843 domain-containing protein n=1 Tax=Arachidicoccus sp. BS20 TaxID=1850526 RepID=UPI0007F11021|nr:DUF4843 domain-containing protein [Arachidicoccus sp. BS20]ANI88660.1 hypothetical protein A9P82_04780 [Arachidicoccus sp. BS20]